MSHSKIHLCTFQNCCEKITSNNYCEHISNGSYTEVLTHSNINNIFELDTLDNVSNWQKSIEDHVNSYIANGKDDSLHSRQYEVLAVAVASLQLFTQLNWVGPPLEWDESILLPKHCLDPDNPWISYINSVLEIDGEPIYHLTKFPSLLAFACTVLLVDSIELPITNIWRMRCFRIHQELLDVKSATLQTKIKNVINIVTEMPEFTAADKHLQIEFHVEATHLLYYYYSSREADNHIKRAQELSGLDIHLTGAMGKRTRFQQKEISQLVLSVERSEQIERPQLLELAVSSDLLKLPKNIPMDDDTVLESIKFSDKDFQEGEINVNQAEQVLIMGLLYHHRKMHEGIGDILKEESLAYVNYILSNPLCWAVQVKALLLRCQWEGDSARRVQRCMAQLEELVNQYNRPEPPAINRMQLIHSVELKPKWNTERQLAELLIHTGMNASALEVYLRLEMWEEVIKCYAALGRKEKAESVIRAELEVKETPTLYCYLGDVTNDPQYYTKAWELSNRTNARSQRCLGYYYLRKMEFSEALPHFQKCLAINFLQVGVWFSYGCTALACKDFKLAAKAFNTCVTLETNNYEAWNNLATAYVRSNQKSRAFVALQEAIKCEYENWRLWENLLLIGSDIGEFGEVIRAYHRLLDIKDKYIDVEVLKILIRAVNEDLKDANEKPSAILRPKLQELFGRLTSKVTTDGSVWKLYAELIHKKQEPSKQDMEMALQYLQKSHRCNTQSFGWEKDVGKCQEIGKQSIELAHVYMEYCDCISEPSAAIQNLSSAKLMLKGVLTKIKLKHTDPVTQEVDPKLDEVISKLSDKLHEIESAVAEKKGN